MYQVLADFVHVKGSAMFLVLRRPIKKIWAGLSRTHALFQCTNRCIRICIALYMPPRRRGDVSGISLMGRAFVAATSERRRSAVGAMSERRRSDVGAMSERRRCAVTAMSQRCRNDVADDNAPLGIAPLGHRNYYYTRACVGNKLFITN